MTKKLYKKDFQWRIGHPSESFEQLANTIRRYGIHVYSDPAWETSDYAFIVSPRKLSKKEVTAVSVMFNREWYKELKNEN